MTEENTRSPTGRRIVSLFAIVRVKDGRLVEEWGGLDQVDMLRRLRAPGESAPTQRAP
jgi:predicted ester cyclase